MAVAGCMAVAAVFMGDMGMHRQNQYGMRAY